MKKIVFFVFFCLFIFSSCKEKSSPNVVYEFKGGKVTTEDLFAHRKKMALIPSFKRKDVSGEDVLNHSINMEMIIREGLERKLHLDPYIREEIHYHMSNIFLKALSKKLVPEINKKEITDQEVKQYYLDNKKSYDPGKKYIFSLVEIGSESEMDTITSLIQEGGDSYKKISEKYPTKIYGPATVSTIQPTVFEKLKTLTPGKAAGPILHKNKQYAVYLKNILAPETFNYEKRKAYIKNDLLYSKYRTEWEKKYEFLRKKHGVTVNTEPYERFKKKYRENKK